MRCEACLAKQRAYDKAWRAKQKGATVEPQCNVSGKLRAEHVYDEDGLCDCGARRMEFAPRPPLRPEIVKATKVAKPKVSAPPAVVRAIAPAPVQRAATKASPRKPRAKRRAIVPAAQPEQRIGGHTFGELISDLERKRAQVDACIIGLRAIEKWWPRS